MEHSSVECLTFEVDTTYLQVVAPFKTEGHPTAEHFLQPLAHPDGRKQQHHVRFAAKLTGRQHVKDMSITESVGRRTKRIGAAAMTNMSGAIECWQPCTPRDRLREAWWHRRSPTNTWPKAIVKLVLAREASPRSCEKNLLEMNYE